MLGYLDALIGALSLRDRAAILRLLEHPRARILPGEARAEAEAFAAGERDALAAPLRVMQLRHQTAELLRDGPMVADRAEEPVVAREIQGTPRAAPPPALRRPPRMVQMELPLSA
jgi:hypothetical protein